MISLLKFTKWGNFCKVLLETFRDVFGENIISVLFHVICPNTQQVGIDVTGENSVKNILLTFHLILQCFWPKHTKKLCISHSNVISYV